MLALFFGGAPASGETLEGITFAVAPGRIFIPAHEAARELRMPVEIDDKSRVVRMNGRDIAAGTLRQLVDGTELINTEQLAAMGAEVTPPDSDGTIKVGRVFRGFKVRPGVQRVEISLPNQTLYGWQGDRLVLKTRISSGRNGATPGGDFRAGPYRAAMHRSSRYNNAPMPWSVQINGHIFVHGFTSVPNYPASHGCIRVPLTEGNPAKFFYEWVLTGTPVKVMK
ncbi:MAG: L,D-transpeptidase [Verrucomicrobiaceae bacterium]|nr:L,D-transpeptidase [Verrucomicrobiaceae bacterium]